jgi:LL-diaminopimelate aminotransferase
MRLQTTKFNGASYPIQRAAAATYSEEGRRQVRELTDYYLENARLIRRGIDEIGLSSVGGVDSPYVWVDAGRPSWELFDQILQQTGVVTTPGAGFGPAGEGFIRISAFNDRDQVETAMDRIRRELG